MVEQIIVVELIVKELAVELVIALVTFIVHVTPIKFIVVLATFSSFMAFIDAIAFISSSFITVAFVAMA